MFSSVHWKDRPFFCGIQRTVVIKHGIVAGASNEATLILIRSVFYFFQLSGTSPGSLFSLYSITIDGIHSSCSYFMFSGFIRLCINISTLFESVYIHFDQSTIDHISQLIFTSGTFIISTQPRSIDLPADLWFISNSQQSQCFLAISLNHSVSVLREINYFVIRNGSSWKLSGTFFNPG